MSDLVGNPEDRFSCVEAQFYVMRRRVSNANGMFLGKSISDTTRQK